MANVNGMPKHHTASPTRANLAEAMCSSDQQTTDGLGRRRLTTRPSSLMGTHHIMLRKLDSSPGHKATKLTQMMGMLWYASSPKPGAAEKRPNSRASATCSKT